MARQRKIKRLKVKNLKNVQATREKKLGHIIIENILFIVFISAVIVLMIAIYSWVRELTVNNIGNDVVEMINSAESNASSLRETDEYKQQLLEALKEEGITSSDVSVEDVKVTDEGLAVLGDVAKPMKSFKTLAEAEEAFGYYMGLHNTVNDGTRDWSLISVYSIDENLMYCRYESETNGKKELFTLKTTKAYKSDILASMYNIDSIAVVDIDGVQCKIGTSLDNKLLVSYFDADNGKSYAIHNGNGFDRDSLMAITTELVHNLMGMDDWE